MTRTTPGWLVVALLFGAVTTGCAEDFAPYNRLTSLRVLAVQSEPVAPAAGEITTLTPLVYVPPYDTVTSYQWSWCPFPGSSRDGYPCLVTEEELAALGGGAGAAIPGFDLGTGETASLENAVDPAILAVVCQGTPDLPELIDCTGGFPVQIKLTVRSGSGEVTAVRTLRLRFDPATEANANPQLDGLAAVLDSVEQPLDDTGSVTLPRQADTVLRASFSLDHAETYLGEDEEGQPAAQRERLILSWFVESGDIDSRRTSFIEDIVAYDDARENEWKPAGVDDYPDDVARLIVVMRDDRDGVSWLTARVRLAGAQ